MKVPISYPTNTNREGKALLDKLDGVALNQIDTDLNIITEILRSSYEDGAKGSAIKIGDIWLSIPSKYLSVYNHSEGKYMSPNDIVGANKEETFKLRRKYGIDGVMSKHPLEKFTNFSIPAQNSIIVKDPLNAPSALAVDENRPPSKILILTFRASPQSIHNNIRPMIAQFSVAPFIPILNADLHKLITPLNELYPKAKQLKMAFMDANGSFRFTPKSKILRQEFLSNLQVEVDVQQASDSFILKSEEELEDYYRTRAYWLIPFYVQLIDYNIVADTESNGGAYVYLTLNVVDPSPTFGEITRFITNESAVNKAIEAEDRLRRLRFGDNKDIINISKMMGIQAGFAVDSPLELTGDKQYKPYSLLDPEFSWAITQLIDKSVYNETEIRFNKPYDFDGDWYYKSANILNYVEYGLIIQPSDDTIYKNYKFDAVFIPGLFNGKVTDELVNSEYGFWYAPYSMTDSILIPNHIKHIKRFNKSYENDQDKYKYNYIDEIFLLTKSFKKSKTQYFASLAFSHSFDRNKYFILAKMPTTYKYKSRYDPHWTALRKSSILVVPSGEKFDSDNIESNNIYNELSFKIGQYNCKNLSKSVGPTDNTVANPNLRIGLFANFIFQKDLDVIGLEEIDHISITEITDILNLLTDKYKYTSVHANQGQNLGIGIITRVPVSKIHRHIPIQNDSNGIEPAKRVLAGIDIFGSAVYTNYVTDSRPILQVDIEKQLGNTITIFLCHFRSKLDIKNERIRKIESEVLLNKIRELPDDRPFIVLGDFNYNYIPDIPSTTPPPVLKFVPGKEVESSSISGIASNTVTINNNSIYHRFRYRSGNNLVEAKGDDIHTSIFQNTLDLIISEDTSLAQRLEEDTRLIFGNKFIQEYYERYYGVDTEKTETFRKYILFPSYKINSERDVSKLRKKGTFFLEGQSVSEPWTTIDHIFYSYHWFIGQNVEHSNETTSTNNVIRNYNDSFILLALKDTNGEKEVIKESRTKWWFNGNTLEQLSQTITAPNRVKDYREFVKNPPTTKLIEYSDHFPVISSFTWGNNKSSDGSQRIEIVSRVYNLYPNYENINKFKGFSEYSFTSAEAFPSLSNKYVNLSKLFEISETNTQFNSGLITGIYRSSKLKVAILSIFYSNIVGNYVFVAYLEDIESGRNTITMVPVVDDTKPDIIQRAISDCYSGSTKATNYLMLLFLNNKLKTKNREDNNSKLYNSSSQLQKMLIGYTFNIQGFRIKTDDIIGYRDINIEEEIENDPTLKYNIANISNKDRSMVNSYEELDPTKFQEYFVSDNVQEGLERVFDHTDITYNISASIPFRNFYLPILEEYRDALNQFDWSYQYQPDEFGGYLNNYRMDDLSNLESKIEMVRKEPNPKSESIIGKGRAAITQLAQLTEGSDSEQQVYMGSIAERLMNGGSTRIRLIIQVAKQEQKDISLVYTNIRYGNAPYINVLAIEVLLDILVKIEVILFILSDKHLSRLSKEVKGEPFLLEETIWKGSIQKTKDAIVREIAVRAINDNDLATIGSLPKIRRELLDYVDTERNFGASIELRDSNNMDSNVREELIKSDAYKNPDFNYDGIIKTYENARESYINYIASVLANPDENTKEENQINFEDF